MTRAEHTHIDKFDAVVLGAGAAGLFCAGVAASRGLRVLVLDHGKKIAEKIRISGGGRCNFTNQDLDPSAPHQYFMGENPHFCRSALSRYTPQDFIALLNRYGVPYHEKHKGQLFCDNSSNDIIDMLLSECKNAKPGSVEIRNPVQVNQVNFEYATNQNHYILNTNTGAFECNSLVVATGGLSIPQIGASDFGYTIAKQFNLPVVPPRPALVPLTFDQKSFEPFASLSGLSLPAVISYGSKKSKIQFQEDLLFTHRGLSGPGILQISSYWGPGEPVSVNLYPSPDLIALLLQTKHFSKKLLVNELSQWIPTRLAQVFTDKKTTLQKPFNQISDQALGDLARELQNWEIYPSGTEGYKKAEVTAGGVHTKALNQKTMESTQKGLYFIGEVVDITGWLGGYNFQWAWSSAYVCAQSLPVALK
jgi:hypothetical protein